MHVLLFILITDRVSGLQKQSITEYRILRLVELAIQTSPTRAC